MFVLSVDKKIQSGIGYWRIAAWLLLAVLIVNLLRTFLSFLGAIFLFGAGEAAAWVLVFEVLAGLGASVLGLMFSLIVAAWAWQRGFLGFGSIFIYALIMGAMSVPVWMVMGFVVQHAPFIFANYFFSLGLPASLLSWLGLWRGRNETVMSISTSSWMSVGWVTFSILLIAIAWEAFWWSFLLPLIFGF